MIAAISAPWTVAGIVLLAFVVLLVVVLVHKIRDAEIRAELRRRLDEAERLKDLSIMAGGLAHEIRHPVSSVQFALESAESRLAKLPEDDITRDLRGILDGVRTDMKRLEEITQAFLQYARPEAQPPEDCDLQQACEFVLRFLKIEIRSRDVNVETEFPEEPVVVRIPEVHLRQILMNLVQNATQASPPGGIVRVRVLAERGRATVEIEDAGAGVSEDALPNLFKPFFSTKSDGVGLGLALSRRLARDADGDLAYQCAATGGALFSLELPIASANVESGNADADKGNTDHA